MNDNNEEIRALLLKCFKEDKTKDIDEVMENQESYYKMNDVFLIPNRFRHRFNKLV